MFLFHGTADLNEFCISIEVNLQQANCSLVHICKGPFTYYEGGFRGVG